VAKSGSSRRHQLPLTVIGYQQLREIVSNRQSSSFVIVYHHHPMRARRRFSSAVAQNRSSHSEAHRAHLRRGSICARDYSLIRDNRSSWVRSHRAAPLRVTIAAWLRAAVLCRVLFPALMKAGAGKQNAVVVIVVRRYGGHMVFAGLGLLSSSIITMIIDRGSQAATVTAINCYL
jgi:hypothetical protein